MPTLNLFITVLPVVLSAVGTWFVVREVSLGHRFETIHREMTVLKEMMNLYRTDLREFWIVSAMDSFNWDRAKAEVVGELLSDEEIRKAVDQRAKELYERDVSEALRRWQKQTAPATLRLRKRWLWVGFWCLMAAAFIQAVQAVVKTGQIGG